MTPDYRTKIVINNLRNMANMIIKKCDEMMWQMRDSAEVKDFQIHDSTRPWLTCKLCGERQINTAHLYRICPKCDKH